MTHVGHMTGDTSDTRQEKHWTLDRRHMEEDSVGNTVGGGGVGFILGDTFVLHGGSKHSVCKMGEGA